jgi:hypothetical protein
MDSKLSPIIPMSSVLTKDSGNKWIVEHQTYNLNDDNIDVVHRISVTTHRIFNLSSIPKEFFAVGKLVDGIVMPDDKFKINYKNNKI